MLLADVVATSAAVGATRARTQKIAALASLLQRLAPEEVVPAVAFLSGTPRQGRVGVGYRTLYAIDAPPSEHPTVGVVELDELISRLQALGGAGSQRARSELLHALFSSCTAEEAEFVRRLLTGELRQGALEGVMADAIARAAEVPATAVRRAAMLAGDLCVVAAAALGGGETALAAIGLELLRPVQPMLATTAGGVGEAISALGMSSVEWKLDGARIQAHRRGDDVRLFTRNLNDVTSRLPLVVETVRSLPVDTVVLDGEVLGIGDDERPELFQDAMSRFSRKDTDVASPLAVRFFDCLHADGDDLLDRTLVERLDVLSRVAGQWRIPGVVTDDAAVGEAFLDDALRQGHEGVMVKAISSPYEAGRRGAAWQKVKPVVTLDLVVLAAEWGYGRRQGWLSNIHVGARDPAGGGFAMVGKTFKGLTDKVLEWQTARFLELETRREGIAVFLRPEQVVEIAIDGVQRSTRYAGGVALRFARVRRYRSDKTAAEVDTIDSVRALLR